MSLSSSTSTPEDDDSTFYMSTGSLISSTNDEYSTTESDSTSTTKVDSLISGKLKKYLKKYNLEFFKNGCTNKFIDLSNLPEVDPSSDTQLFYYEKNFVSKNQMEHLMDIKAEEQKHSMDLTNYEILDSCDVMKKVANRKDCSTCHENCESCHISHAKKWYDKLNVSSKKDNSQISDSDSLTFKSSFKEKYYTSLYCHPYNLSKYGSNLFTTYKNIEKEAQNSRLTKYRKILVDDEFEFVDDSQSIYKENKKKVKKINKL
ncbi:Hypothetical protein SRAE_2000074400 [Strongyloides ratti]|uniref:Uncharacterized protein n=1 Tax=Strongyloides ratti TaxID=34506 RepID=A0A090MXV1_STRRB|nr:Hypothetical protein SRAE_2000074400 [Strongyloides ratti]CEF66074.1 Hypothetical protein SRAE_2000074400 [Strongyloides ratti]